VCSVSVPEWGVFWESCAGSNQKFWGEEKEREASHLPMILGELPRVKGEKFLIGLGEGRRAPAEYMDI